MSRLAGKVALVTGAARGQGRCHAVRLAREGARILALDLVSQFDTASYELASPADLKETVKLVRQEGAEIIARRGDVRSQSDLDELVQAGVEEFGRLDIAVANAGVAQRPDAVWQLDQQEWNDILDINLTGVWHAVKSVVPHMIRQGTGGTIVITSSSTATKPVRNLGAYSTAKSGLTGFMKVLALELAQHSIRVNTVNPGSVGTPMLLSDRIFRLFRPDLEQPTADDARPVFQSLNALPTPWVEAEDVSNAVAWLVSDEARFVTGAVIPVDAGATLI